MQSLKDEEENYFFKFTVCGDVKVGKFSIIQRIVENIFQENWEKQE